MNATHPHTLPWQSDQWQYLQKRIQQQSLPHAIMLSGIADVGKTLFANAIIHSLLCEQRDEAGYACGKCRACHWLSAQSHPDLLILEPEEPGASIKIEAVRHLIDRFTQRAHQGGFKIALINPAEAMPIGATNALLKILEEPTPNTLILLISQQAQLLPATIRSRCQNLLFPLPNSGMASAWISQQLKVSLQEATRLLMLADGAPLIALSLKEESSLQDQQLLLQQLTQLRNKEIDPVAVANHWTKKPLLLTLTYWQTELMDILYKQLDITKTQASHSSIQSNTTNTHLDVPNPLLKQFSQQINAIALFHFYDKTNQLRRQLVNHYNPNVQLALEDLFCAWMHLSK